MIKFFAKNDNGSIPLTNFAKKATSEMFFRVLIRLCKELLVRSLPELSSQGRTPLLQNTKYLMIF